MKRISVIIAEDHTMVREGLFTMLSLEPDIEVVGEARNGREAVSLAELLKPDVVIMDIAMPVLNGLEATRKMKKLLPAIRVIILSAHSDDAYVRSAVESGAKGFLLKQDSTRDICRAIRETYRGGIHYSKTIAKRYLRINPTKIDSHGQATRTPNSLTSRETEVLQLVAEGMTNKETAAALGISIKTVEKHRGHLMTKLDIHDTASLTRHAIATGIIESSVQNTTL